VSVSKVVDSVFEYRPIGYGASVFSGFAFKSSDLKGEGIPVIKIGNIQNRVVDYSNTQFFPEEKVTSRHEKYFLSDGDVLIAMTGQGSVGRVGKIRILDSKKILLNQRVGKFAVDNINLDNNYLYYIISSPLYESILFNAGTGSGQPNLSAQDILSVEIPYPDIKEQKAIAATLSALDDMIELNNKINKTLEEMAQAIFKSWFVDFEPFKDEEFEESELGLIPKGWRVAALDEIATYLNGLAMQKYPPSKNERGLPVLKIKELRQGFTDGNSDICSESIDNSYIINDGDIIFSWSGSLLVDIWCGGRCGLNQHLFKVTSASYNKWFYYMWTRYHLERFIAIAKDKATTMGHIQRKHLSEAKVLIPEPNTLAFMDSVMQPIIDLVIANKVENKTLSTIRDTLLPKLMTGEIRVPVEEVV
jgi:type I restriction enzyme S subunit